jgi:hypothetical protein
VVAKTEEGSVPCRGDERMLQAHRAELHKSEEIQASAQNVRLDSTVVSDAIVEI